MPIIITCGTLRSTCLGSYSNFVGKAQIAVFFVVVVAGGCLFLLLLMIWLDTELRSTGLLKYLTGRYLGSEGISFFASWNTSPLKKFFWDLCSRFRKDIELPRI